MSNNYKKVEKIVAKVCGLSEEDIFQNNRSKEFATARFMFCHILYDRYILRNVSAIGRLMNRDHSTVLNALKKHEDFNMVDRLYQRQYKQVLELVNKQILNCESFDLNRLFKRIDVNKYCETCNVTIS